MPSSSAESTHEADLGLVPYTGVMPIEVFVDHTGPMTATVADNAVLLEVLAGDDGYIRASRRRRSRLHQGLGAASRAQDRSLKEGSSRPARSRRQ